VNDVLWYTELNREIPRANNCWNVLQQNPQWQRLSAVNGGTASAKLKTFSRDSWFWKLANFDQGLPSCVVKARKDSALKVLWWNGSSALEKRDRRSERCVMFVDKLFVALPITRQHPFTARACRNKITTFSRKIVNCWSWSVHNVTLLISFLLFYLSLKNDYFPWSAFWPFAFPLQPRCYISVAVLDALHHGFNLSRYLRFLH